MISWNDYILEVYTSKVIAKENQNQNSVDYTKANSSII